MRKSREHCLHVYLPSRELSIRRLPFRVQRNEIPSKKLCLPTEILNPNQLQTKNKNKKINRSVSQSLPSYTVYEKAESFLKLGVMCRTVKDTLTSWNREPIFCKKSEKKSRQNFGKISTHSVKTT